MASSTSRTPKAGVDECLANARPIYEAAKTPDALKFMAEPKTPHKVTSEGYQAAFDWFKQWLKPVAQSPGINKGKIMKEIFEKK